MIYGNLILMMDDFEQPHEAPRQLYFAVEGAPIIGAVSIDNSDGAYYSLSVTHVVLEGTKEAEDLGNIPNAVSFAFSEENPFAIYDVNPEFKGQAWSPQTAGDMIPELALDVLEINFSTAVETDGDIGGFELPEDDSFSKFKL